jgi:hypothetical protein
VAPIGKIRLKAALQLLEQLARNQALAGERQSCMQGAENRASLAQAGHRCVKRVMR